LELEAVGSTYDPRHLQDDEQERGDGKAAKEKSSSMEAPGHQHNYETCK